MKSHEVLKLDGRMRRHLLVVLTLSYLSTTALAVTNFIKAVPCSILNMILGTLNAVVPALVIIFFLYGGVKYIFSADDPKGRGQAKSILINALIGGIIYMVWTAINTMLSTVSGGSGPTGMWGVC
ncbi:MAG: hypothetical protein GF416_08135 [Candidatus Altiarchaeales archaeon]|nr:hypothetical protein [Candidatus Altiarchaeales archaeon]MBD3417083.1 hypothetical protein [Candidatus Altiarchaeales archaeon]